MVNDLKEKLEDYLYSKWEFDREGLYKLSASIILYADAALQLKEKRYDTAMGIKNSGIPYAKIFEMMGYDYSEIDYSHHKRQMEEIRIDSQEIKMLKNKKIILIDMDIFSGKTILKITEYLKEKNLNVKGAFIGKLNFWAGSDYCWNKSKAGLRELRKLKLCSHPVNIPVFTFTQEEYIEKAKERVSDYLAEKLNRNQKCY